MGPWAPKEGEANIKMKPNKYVTRDMYMLFPSRANLPRLNREPRVKRAANFLAFRSINGVSARAWRRNSSHHHLQVTQQL